MTETKLINIMFADDMHSIPATYRNALCLWIVSELVFTASQRTIENLAYQMANNCQLPVEISLKISEPMWLINELTELAEDLSATTKLMLETLNQQETTNENS
jgi:hypothetical protein